MLYKRAQTFLQNFSPSLDDSFVHLCIRDSQHTADGHTTELGPCIQQPGAGDEMNTFDNEGGSSLYRIFNDAFDSSKRRDDKAWLYRT
jgi:hypothetical protein